MRKNGPVARLKDARLKDAVFTLERLSPSESFPARSTIVVDRAFLDLQ